MVILGNLIFKGGITFVLLVNFRLIRYNIKIIGPKDVRIASRGIPMVTTFGTDSKRSIFCGLPSVCVA